MQQVKEIITQLAACWIVLDIAKRSNYDGYQRGLASVVYKFFDKKFSCGAAKGEIMANQQLDEKLHKPIVRKFEKRNVYSSFKGNI